MEFHAYFSFFTNPSPLPLPSLHSWIRDILWNFCVFNYHASPENVCKKLKLKILIFSHMADIFVKNIMFDFFFSKNNFSAVLYTILQLKNSNTYQAQFQLNSNSSSASTHLNLNSTQPQLKILSLTLLSSSLFSFMFTSDR